MHIFLLISIASLTSAVPVPQNDFNKKQLKRGFLDNIDHFPFLASSSSSSSSSSGSKDHEHEHDHEHDFHDYHHDSIPDFHSVSHTSHVIHHPETDEHHHHDFLHQSFDLTGHDDVAISYQNQHFGHLFDNHLSLHDDHFTDDHFDKFSGLQDSLLFSNLDAPEYLDEHVDDYKNYGGDLEQYSHHAGLLDISDDHKIDHLLDPYSPSHSSYDSY